MYSDRPGALPLGTGIGLDKVDALLNIIHGIYSCRGDST